MPFWQRLGLSRTGGDAGYIIMTGWVARCTYAGRVRSLEVPEDNNPFGILIRAPDVDAIAARLISLFAPGHPALP